MFSKNGRYRFARIYAADPWNPGMKAPLTEPSAQVKVGEYLLAVNGKSLSGSDNIYRLFEGTTGKPTVLRVGPDPNGSRARDITVTPIANELSLRHWAWIAEATQESLLINEYAGSGGDALALFFRKLGVGPILGKRTWGGLTGAFDTPELMDGGVVEIPDVAFWDPDGVWAAENRGIAPDLEVEFDPEQGRKGHDPQLEKAIATVLHLLHKKPLLLPKRPPYPNYSSQRLMRWAR